MSEPLNTRTIQHWLNFITSSEGMIQIDEPVGFDGANFVVNQEEGRYGRDVSFAGGEIDFGFPNSTGHRYGYQFALLTTYDRISGYESEVQYILRDSTTDYVVGEVDFVTKKTDGFTYFDTKIIQSTKQAVVKRRSKIGVDLFGTEDLDGNTITAIGTSNILLEAKPTVEKSKWGVTLPYWTATGDNTTINRFNQNPFTSITTSEIQDTISFIDRAIEESVPTDTDFYNKVYDTGWIDAQEDLSVVTNDLTSIVMSFFIATGSSFNDDWLTTPSIRYQQYVFPIGQEDYQQVDVYPSGNSFTQNTNLAFNSVFIGNESISRFGSFSGTADRYDVTITDTNISLNEGVPRGFRLCTLFNIRRTNTIVEWISGDVEVQATSTAINSITKGIRLVDAMSQVLLNINGELALTAPRFESGGEFYDNFIFDGNMIRGRETKYPLEWDDIANFCQEFNCDYEIVDDSVFYGKYDDYYTSIESGVFLQIPDELFNITYNELYGINQFNFNYKKFNQDKDDDNTIDGMHTEAQFAIINKKVENNKEIELDQIRDPFLMETTRKKATLSNESATSSLSQDNKTFMVDVVELTSETGSEKAPLNHIVNDDSTGYLLLVNNGSFNWTLLGFSVSDTFTIVNTDNADTFTVITIEGNTLTLDPDTITATNIGLNITEFEFPYSNVDFKMRTDEGFTSITGVLSPDTFGNLLYTPKRNILNNWTPYLATAAAYNTADIKIQSFVNEPTLVTQFGGGDIITENSNITQAEFATALLTPRLIECRVITDFSTYQTFRTSIRADRGFVRIYDNEKRVLKGYPKESTFHWADNILEFILEQKFESEITNITFDSGASVYLIDEVGYDQDTVPQLEFETEGDYIQFFDSITRPLTNLSRYDRVSVDSVVYDSILELVDAISLL